MGRYLATSKDNVPIASSVLKLEVLLMLVAFFFTLVANHIMRKQGHKQVSANCGHLIY